MLFLGDPALHRRPGGRLRRHARVAAIHLSAQRSRSRHGASSRSRCRLRERGGGWRPGSPRREKCASLSRKWRRRPGAFSSSSVNCFAPSNFLRSDRLAAGVAHEIRNPLTGIKMLVEAALRPQAPRPLNLEDTQVIFREVKPLEQTVQQFLNFARLPAPQIAACDLRSTDRRGLGVGAGPRQSAACRAVLSFSR